MSAFSDLGTIEPQRIWDGVVARSVHSERVTMAYIELDAGVEVP